MFCLFKFVIFLISHLSCKSLEGFIDILIKPGGKGDKGVKRVRPLHFFCNFPNSLLSLRLISR